MLKWASSTLFCLTVETGFQKIDGVQKDTFVNPLKLPQFTILKKADENMELLEQDIKTYFREIARQYY